MTTEQVGYVKSIADCAKLLSKHAQELEEYANYQVATGNINHKVLDDAIADLEGRIRVIKTLSNMR